MQKNPTPTGLPLIVVAAALTDASGRVLVAQRRQDQAHPGSWEFPGGKVEPGERAEDALVRELAEELGIGVTAEDLSPAGFTTVDRAPDRQLLLLLYRCSRWTGTPSAIEVAALRWIDPGDRDAVPLVPADRRLAAAL